MIACAIAGIYNNMVTKRNRIDNAWQNIDTQLQRRNDLILTWSKPSRATPNTSRTRLPPWSTRATPP